jgi:hypothetical protein
MRVSAREGGWGGVGTHVCCCEMWCAQNRPPLSRGRAAACGLIDVTRQRAPCSVTPPHCRKGSSSSSSHSEHPSPSHSGQDSASSSLSLFSHQVISDGIAAAPQIQRRGCRGGVCAVLRRGDSTRALPWVRPDRAQDRNVERVSLTLELRVHRVIKAGYKCIGYWDGPSNVFLDSDGSVGSLVTFCEANGHRGVRMR